MSLILYILSGNIGCGKSTTLGIIRALTQDDPCVTVIQEDVESWGYFLDKAYEAPKEFAFLLQMEVLCHYQVVTRKLYKFKEKAKTTGKNQVVIVERSICDALEVFIANNEYGPGQKEKLVGICEEYTKLEIWKGAKFVFMDVPLEICYNRIAARSRKGENHIQKEYLCKLDGAYREMAKRRGGSAVIVRLDDPKLGRGGAARLVMGAISGISG